MRAAHLRCIPVLGIRLVFKPAGDDLEAKAASTPKIRANRSFMLSLGEVWDAELQVEHLKSDPLMSGLGSIHRSGYRISVES